MPFRLDIDEMLRTLMMIGQYAQAQKQQQYAPWAGMEPEQIRQTAGEPFLQEMAKAYGWKFPQVQGTQPTPTQAPAQQIQAIQGILGGLGAGFQAPQEAQWTTQRQGGMVLPPLTTKGMLEREQATALQEPGTLREVAKRSLGIGEEWTVHPHLPLMLNKKTGETKRLDTSVLTSTGTPDTGEIIKRIKEENPDLDVEVDTDQWGMKNIKLKSKAVGVEKNLTTEQITYGALKEELGRPPTMRELQARIYANAKGFDTAQEALAEAQKMVKAAGPDAGIVPSYELSPQNKYVPKVLPNITLRIPPLTQVTAAPGISYNRRTGQWSEVLPDGSTRVLSSAEVQQRGLEYAEAKPTETTKTMKQMAPKVIDLAKRIQAQIKSDKGLGPAKSRWRDFWSGRVGTEDPSFRKLRVDAELLSTLLSRMHVGARGSEAIIKRFTDMLSSGTQSPENMQAALDEIIDYAENTAKSTISPTTTGGKSPTQEADEYLKKFPRR